MHFTVGDLILKLISEFSPGKITPVDTDITRVLYDSYVSKRNQTVELVTESSHWQSIYEAHAAHYNRLRKLNGMDYISELAKLVPASTMCLVCRLYALETIILGYNTTPKFVVEYED